MTKKNLEECYKKFYDNCCEYHRILLDIFEEKYDCKHGRCDWFKAYVCSLENIPIDETCEGVEDEKILDMAYDDAYEIYVGRYDSFEDYCLEIFCDKFDIAYRYQEDISPYLDLNFFIEEQGVDYHVAEFCDNGFDEVYIFRLYDKDM